MRTLAPRPSDKVRAYLRGLWSRARRRAERDGIRFEIASADLEGYWRTQGGRCALSGRPLGIETGKYGGRVDGRRILNASVDRKNSSLGYTRENCWLVAAAVNIAKNVLAVNTFVALCGSVAAAASEAPPTGSFAGRAILLEEEEDGADATSAEDFAAAIARYAWKGARPIPKASRCPPSSASIDR